MAKLIDSDPLVSVIIPTYNSAHLIGKTLNSVRNQTFRNLEIIVVDDGSTDNTEKVIEEIIDVDERVHYKKIDNSNSPTARNVGFKLARGDYVTVIDSDDLWPSNKVEIQLTALNENPDAVVVGWVQRFTEDTVGNRQLGAVSRPPSNNGDYVHNLLSMDLLQMVNLNTLCVKRSILCNDGLWDPEFETAHDWEVWIRLAKKHPFIHVNEILQHYRKHGSSVTRHAKWEFALKYQLMVVDRHAPTGLRNIWKRLHYRRIRYHCYISTLAYEKQIISAIRLWIRSTLRSSMLLSMSGIKLLAQVFEKAVRH